MRPVPEYIKLVVSNPTICSRHMPVREACEQELTAAPVETDFVCKVTERRLLRPALVLAIREMPPCDLRREFYFLYHRLCQHDGIAEVALT